jgi:hypothetical protein
VQRRVVVMTMVALFGVLAGLGPAVPVSAGPPEFTVELSIDPTSGPAGSTVTVTGTCLFGDVPGDEFGINMYATPGQGLPPTAKIFQALLTLVWAGFVA